MSETKRIAIIDKNGLDKVANVVESTSTPGVFGFVAVNPDGTPIGGGGTWGSITGNILDQTDLQTRLSHVETTGVLSWASPYVGTIAGQTTINIKAGTGQIVDAITGTITPVSWAEQTIANPYIGISEQTHVAVDSSGTLVTYASYPSEKQYSDTIYLIVVANTTTSQITYSFAPEYAGGLGNTIQQYARNQGPENVLGKIEVNPSGANLNIKRAPGKMSRKGANFANISTDEANDPLLITFADPLSFSHTYKTATGYTITGAGTTLDTSNYNPVSGGLSTYTGYQIMRYFQVGNQAGIVAYGQNTYPNIATAQSAISTDSFVGSSLLENQLLIAYIIVKAGTTNLSNASDCIFIQTKNIGGSGTGGGSGDVTGPSSSTIGSIATFSDTTGKVIQDANLNIGSLHQGLLLNGIL